MTRDENHLPGGFELVRAESRQLLALPLAAARDYKALLRRRTEEAEAAHREEIRLEREAAKAETLKESRAKQGNEALAQSVIDAQLKALDSPPQPGFYRVLPKLDFLVPDPDDVGANLRSADGDANRRQAQVRKHLVEKGPDRRIAMPEEWRKALDVLEASLPHFRGPIELLRTTLALAEVTKQPPRVPPILLLGAPGLGKTFFSHQVAELMDAPHAILSMDQPTAGNSLRGTDKHWSNSSTGMLFELILMNEDSSCANPVILLDEVDKSAVDSNINQQDPLAQLHSALEPQTSRRIVDISVNIEFDASLVTYIATANDARRIGAPLLSRMEIFTIEPPRPAESMGLVQAIVGKALARLQLEDKLSFERRALLLLAHMSARLMVRTVDKAVAAAVTEGREEIRESDLWTVTRMGDGPRLH